MHRWLQDKGKSREVGHSLEHPEMCQATNPTPESLGYPAFPFSSMSGISEFSVSGSAVCLLLAATRDYHHWAAQQGLRSRNGAASWDAPQTFVLTEPARSVLSPTAPRPALSLCTLPAPAGRGTADCFGVSLGS